MKPEEAFGVVVRSIGLILLVWGVALFPGLWSRAEGWMENHMIYILFYIGAGSIFLSMADGIVRFAYLRSREQSE